MRNPQSELKYKGAIGAICLATAFFSGGCAKQFDGTDLSDAAIAKAALKPNVVDQPKEIAPGIFQVPATQWPGWLTEFKQTHEGLRIASIAPAGQAQTNPGLENNTTVITSFVVVTEAQ